MKWTGLTLLFGLSCTCLVLGEVFPPGRQWTYAYHALVRAGTLASTEAHSQWELQGSLFVTGVATGDVLMRFGNLSVAEYNGPRERASEKREWVLISDRALSSAFVVHYARGTSLAEGVSASVTDPLWAVNMKRAVASVLQLHDGALSSGASLVVEEGLRGKCAGVEHSVLNNTEYVYVRKVIDAAACDRSSVDWSSAPPFPCPGAEEDAYSASTTREYTLARQPDDRLELRHVMSSGRTYVQPFRATAEAHQAYQYQSYNLTEAGPSVSTEPLPRDLVRHGLAFEHDADDLTQGRASAEQPKLVSRIHKLLDELVGSLDDPEPRRPDERALTRLYYGAFLLDLPSLRVLYADIEIGTSYKLETKRNVFLELLPQIGTQASARFTKELIIGGRLKDLAAIKLLSVFPFYVRRHSVELLADMEALLGLGDGCDPNIRRTAVLAFATLVHQAAASGYCPPELLEHYAKRYFDLFSRPGAAYGERMLYLQALDNLQLGPVFSYMSSVVQNSAGQFGRHERFLAVWASMLGAPYRPQQIYELYWPMLVDRSQHLEMRVAAFTMLLVAQPTKSRLLTLYWYMQGEPDRHLYSFFRTTLASLHRTTYPCYKHLGRLAQHVSRFARHAAPDHWTTGNYLLDYRDEASAFGGMAQLFLVGDPRTGAPNVVYVTFNSYATGRALGQAAVYLKLQGVPERVKRWLQGVQSVASLERLVTLLETAGVELPLSPEPVHVELIAKVQGKSVFCQHFDADSLDKMAAALTHLKMFLEYHMNYQSIFLPYLSEHVEPSDVGTLVLRGIVSNSVASTRGNSTSHRADKINAYNFDLDLRYYTYTTNFLEVYNPVGNQWHGVHKSRSLQGRFLFNGSVLVDALGPSVRLSEERGGTEYVTLVLQSKTSTYVLGSGGQERLRAVTAGDERQYVDAPLEAFGTRLRATLFECDGEPPDWRRALAEVRAAHLANARALPLAAPLLFALHVLDRATYVLPRRSCGLAARILPLHSSPTELSVSAGPTWLALEHHRLPDGSRLQFWNASLDWRPDARLNLRVERQDAAGERSVLCVEGSTPPEPNHVVAEGKLEWGNIEPHAERTACPTDGAAIAVTLTAAVSEEHSRLTEFLERWPHKDCRESDRGNAFSVPCYLKAREAAAHRNYTAHMIFTEMPERVVTVFERLCAALGQRATPLANASVTLALARPQLALRLNGGEQTVLQLPALAVADDLRTLLSEDWTISLGFDRVCAVSDSTAHTFDNRTVALERSKELLVAAECSERPGFGVFLEAAPSSGELAFTMYSGADAVTVRPGQGVLVTVNDSPMTETEDVRPAALSVWRLDEEAVLVRTKSALPAVSVHYTRRHLLVRVRGPFAGRLCGACAL